jgi:hypothetical protein
MDTGIYITNEGVKEKITLSLSLLFHFFVTAEKGSDLLDEDEGTWFRPPPQS